ncbi:MAG: tryptophan synthase subunit alpha [Myxococcota bacterium]
MTASELEHRLRAAAPNALVAYLTAGYPTMPAFFDLLRRVAEVVDAVEVGVPFTDPMADGPVLQQTGHAALQAGFTLEGLIETLQKERFDIPLLLMSYLNPLLSHGDRLVPEIEKAGISGLVVPDLPLEEGTDIGKALDAQKLAWVQLIAPTTPRPRAKQLAAASRGFVYAVTSRGQTGGDARLSDELTEQLAELKAAATAPVLVGFGVRRRAQVELFSGHADGVIVGSALMDTILKDEDPIAFLRALRP